MKNGPTRPDVAPAALLAMLGTPNVPHLHQMQETVSHARRHIQTLEIGLQPGVDSHRGSRRARTDLDQVAQLVGHPQAPTPDRVLGRRPSPDHRVLNAAGAADLTDQRVVLLPDPQLTVPVAVLDGVDGGTDVDFERQRRPWPAILEGQPRTAVTTTKRPVLMNASGDSLPSSRIASIRARASSPWPSRWRTPMPATAIGCVLELSM